MLNASQYAGSLLSVTEVRVTPDFAEARIFLSVFPVEHRAGVMKSVEENNKQIRFDLAKKLRYQLRRIPELVFYLDDSLDNAERINELLNN